MDELTQTRNHLLTTTTIRSIRVTLRHSLGLIALLGAGIGLAGCGNSAKALSPCEIQIADARRGLLECTVQAFSGDNAGCSDSFLAKVAEVRDQFGASDECPSDSEPNGVLAGIAASFVRDDAPNRPFPKVRFDIPVWSVKHPILQKPGLRPASFFPEFEELFAGVGSARTSDLSSPSQELINGPSGWECTASGWCASQPLSDESTVCVGFLGICPTGEPVPADGTQLIYQGSAVLTPASQACTQEVTISGITPAIPLAFGASVPATPYSITSSYTVLLCPS